MSKGVLDGFRAGLDSILELRDKLGLALAKVELCERTWSGKAIGDGEMQETKRQVYPSPRVVDLSQDIRLMDSGAIRRGDLILKDISRERYERSELMCETEKVNVECFYLVDDYPFKPINIKQRHLTWSVIVRPQAGV